jgi:predicted NBD/HSP70 family sugar kinase/biotin operon repressor
MAQLVGTDPPGRPARKPNLLRELSEQDVLHAVFHDGPLTRPQIARLTGLSKATVGAAVDRLERAGLLAATGAQHGRRGRSPIAYAVRENAGFVVGVDIGGKNIRAGAADIYGDLIAVEQQPTRTGARAVAAQVSDLASALVERVRATHERLLAVGVSPPGVVDLVSRRVTSLAYNVSAEGDLDPLAGIRARWGVPVLIENNVNLAALGESWHGLAHGVSSFAFVAIGAGVGMGLVLGGELVRGAHGAAGEIGYLPISNDPFDERHRLRGGLEDEIGAAGIVAALARRQGQGEAGAPVWRGGRGGRVPQSAEVVFALAETGDPDAIDVIDDVARRLGSAIASVIAVIDPELVVLGGGIGSNGALLEPVRATVAQLVSLPARIETSTLGERAALEGAIALALQEARAQMLGGRTTAR